MDSLDFIQKNNTLVLVHVIINGIYGILNLGVNILDYVTPGLLRHAVVHESENDLFKILVVLSTLVWMAIQGYFISCSICLYRRTKYNIPLTPPSTPSLLLEVHHELGADPGRASLELNELRLKARNGIIGRY